MDYRLWLFFGDPLGSQGLAKLLEEAEDLSELLVDALHKSMIDSASKALGAFASTQFWPKNTVGSRVEAMRLF